MEILTGKRPKIGGVEVHALATQTRVAEWNGLSTRQVRNLEAKGLPTYSRRGRKFYPVPHEFIWYSEYMVELRERGSVNYLSFTEAYERHREFQRRITSAKRST